VLTQVCTGNGKVEDIDLLLDISNNMMGNTICAFADVTAMPMLGFVQRFRDEFDEHVRQGGCTCPESSLRSLYPSPRRLLPLVAAS